MLGARQPQTHLSRRKRGDVELLAVDGVLEVRSIYGEILGALRVDIVVSISPGHSQEIEIRQSTEMWIPELYSREFSFFRWSWKPMRMVFDGDEVAEFSAASTVAPVDALPTNSEVVGG